ncbi:MAG: 16S rRNA (guanine(527)-N(7))-methyltransferase RsmG [Dehalococcoidia bacterium]
MEKLVEGARKLGLHLTSGQVDLFQQYYEQLREWNKRVNLTRIIERDSVQKKHFLDSLTVVQALLDMNPPARRLLDVGSGAGLPGLPIKILWPHIHLGLMDSVGKKTAFLQSVVTSLGLRDVEVLTSRAEDLARSEAHRERYDAVLCRAVAPLPTLMELTLPFCKLGGRVIAQKMASAEGEIARSGKALRLLGGEVQEVRRVELDELEPPRVLVIVEKVATTPDKYPRRAGVPARHPLM